MGANFCHVNKISLMFQFNPSITSGNQEWKGAIPSFIIIAEYDNMNDGSLKKENVELKLNSSKDNEKINKVDASVWIIKYFIVASLE